MIEWVSVISMDSFFKGLTHDQNPEVYNFDHPDAFDFDLLLDIVSKLKQGRNVQIPEYDFKTHSRVKGTSKEIYGADVVILEGIFVLYDDRLRRLLDVKLFVDTEDDIRLARRLKRDIIERGRTVDSVLKQYETFVKPAFENFILPTKQHADIIIPRGSSNKVAINIITQHIKTQLQERGNYDFNTESILEMKEIPRNVNVLTISHEIRYIHTIIRDKNTNRDDFIFYSDRLTRLLIEHAVNKLPFNKKDITTPTGSIYSGYEFYSKVCGINIMRAGDSMLKALRSVIKDVLIGTLLIQSDKEKTPKLFFCKLPTDVQDYYAILLDPIVGTSRTVQMAIRVLLDHGFLETHIIFVTLVANPSGLNGIYQLFPKVQVVCSMIDEGLDNNGFIIPGLGNFGDRYYGTENNELNEEDNLNEDK